MKICVDKERGGGGERTQNKEENEKRFLRFSTLFWTLNTRKRGNRCEKERKKLEKMSGEKEEKEKEKRKFVFTLLELHSLLFFHFINHVLVLRI
mgnify:CR=1 FL=1